MTPTIEPVAPCQLPEAKRSEPVHGGAASAVWETAVVVVGIGRNDSTVVEVGFVRELVSPQAANATPRRTTIPARDIERESPGIISIHV
jgi:hypothetical protein